MKFTAAASKAVLLVLLTAALCLSAAAKTELLRHSWGTFVDEPPSMAECGNGVVVPGCEACKKRANTMTQYMEHLADDVLPVILRRAFAIAQES